jgi:uncharacterized protein
VNRTFKAAVADLVLVVVGFAGSVVAGPFEDGFAAHEKGDYATALRVRRRPLAEQGTASAQYNIGQIYDNGRGVPQDYATAVSWFRKAAEQGDATAQFNLGVMSRAKACRKIMRLQRDGIERWPSKGEADAQYRLGVIYSDGRGSQRTIPVRTCGSIWQPRVGYEGAAYSRDLFAAKMTPAQVAEAQKLAREWKPK